MKKYNILDSLNFMIKEAYRRHKLILIFCVILVIAEVANQLIQLYIAPEIINALLNGASLKEVLYVIIIFGLGLFVTNAIKSYVDMNALFTRVDLRTHIIALLNLKVARTSYINTLKTDFIDKSEKALDACSGNGRPTEAIWKTLIAFAVDVIVLVVYAFVIKELGIYVFLTVALTSLISYLLEVRLTRWAYENRAIDQKNDSHLFYLRNTLTDRDYAKDIRIFGMYSWLNDVWDRFMMIYESFYKEKEKRYLLANVISVVLVLIQNIVAYGILLVGVFDGDIGVATFLLYFNAISGLSSYAGALLKDASKLKRECVDIITILEVLDYPEPYRFDDGVKVPRSKDITIELKDVSYRYPGANKDALSHIDLTLHPKEKLAIVGVNGAGKTTLVKVLCGLLDPTAGQVLLNGVDIRVYDRRSYYALFSTIFQDIVFFEESFKVNVTNTLKDVDLDRVHDALKRAGLDDKIRSLKGGLKAKFGRQVFKDGVVLSGGEMQKLAMARALYKDGPVLILDEPTSALDPLAESAIYEKYGELTSGKPSIFISHRLASTRFCDRIILLDDRSIIEEGTHESLLAKGGIYKEMFDIQSKYYKDGDEYEGH